MIWSDAQVAFSIILYEPCWILNNHKWLNFFPFSVTLHPSSVINFDEKLLLSFGLFTTGQHQVTSTILF